VSIGKVKEEKKEEKGTDFNGTTLRELSLLIKEIERG
jgi:hypothetical protein